MRFLTNDLTLRHRMELALQVVGLKMTGKIEDAKNVALRIVGNTGAEESSSNPNPSNLSQAASTSCDILPLLVLRSDDREKFELSIIKLLSVVDLAIPSRTDVSMATAISHTTSSGQTLLHLAVFLDLGALTEFLIAHDVDLDARDYNGYTALHFAVLAQSQACAKLLIEACADPEIVNSLGKIPQDMAPVGFFDGCVADRPCLDYIDPWYEDDGESQWGDIESEEDDIPTIKRKQVARCIRRHSHHRNCDADDVPGIAEPPISQRQHTVVTADNTQDEAVDEKQAASFVETIQRILTQLPAQSIIPNMPQLPGIPAVPWAALPPIHLVLPIFVPMPGWPSFLSDKREGAQDQHSSNQHTTGSPGHGAARTAHELWATWEKWIALTAVLRPQPAEEAPPVYTPRESPNQGQTGSAPSVSQYPDADSSTTRHSNGAERSSRRSSYEDIPAAVQDVDSFGYMPAKSSSKNVQRKRKYHRSCFLSGLIPFVDDRMLVLFWLPILLRSSLHRWV